MNVGTTIWIIVQLIIGYNLVMPFILLSIYRLRKKEAIQQVINSQEADYAIIVTAYEQTTFLSDVVSSLLRLNYSNYLVYIVADHCDVSNLSFSDPRIILLRPEATIASNTGSHFYAIRHFLRPHQRLTIVDSDNLVHPEYLNELNRYFDQGFKAVQGVRAPKNLNTTFACLDAARDIYYHYYDGKILFGAGSSATLAGSGMAFTTELYRECLEELEIQGAGFDKVLQYEIVKRGRRIAFSEHAVVLDEKTTRSDQLVKQRARWINTWFRYFVFGFRLIKNGLYKGNSNQLLFGTILLRPPLFIFLLLSIACFTINLFIAPVAAMFWSFGIFFFIAGFVFSLINSETDKRVYHSLINIPKFIFFQVLSLAKVGKANRYSVATQHFHKAKVEN
jgi:cellulose synthase/poly-beta-1,6-N-acetylglucosamine synthase-like glycosyltransferase